MQSVLQFVCICICICLTVDATALHTPSAGSRRGGGLDQAAQIWAIRGDEGVKELGVLQVDCLQYFQHLRLGMC